MEPALPVANQSLSVDGEGHRMLGYLETGTADPEQRRMLLVPVRLPLSPLLMAGDDGLSLPTVAFVRDLLRTGRARLLADAAGPAAGERSDEAGRIAAQCDLLDAAGVPNGFKAISIWLHRHWRGPLAERFGDHADPHTLRRWRSRRGRAAPAPP